jgi:hypothetical protein
MTSWDSAFTQEELLRFEQYDKCREEIHRVYLECQELDGSILLESLSLFEQGRIALLKAICHEREEHEDVYDGSADQWRDFKRAGEIIAQSGGLPAMQNELIWKFIPFKVKSKIDLAWDGICGYRAGTM